MIVILDVALGIVFIFLLFSLVVSAANELALSFIRKRADHLWRGIDEMLQDRLSRTNPAAATGPSRVFCNHPLITGLSDGPKGRPSYIAPKTFSLVMLDLLKTGKLGGNSDPANLQALVDEIANPELKRALNALLTGVNNDINAFRCAVEDWFNAGMDRVSGWYKRYTQFSLFILGLIFAVCCNVDSIHILQDLSSNPAARQTLASNAANYVQTHSSTKPAETGEAGVKAQVQDVQAAMQQLTSLNVAIPIGWNDAQSSYFWSKDQNGARQPNCLNWLNAVFGWLLTAFAGTLGAPFWFDTLNRIVNIRGVGKNPSAA